LSLVYVRATKDNIHVLWVRLVGMLRFGILVGLIPTKLREPLREGV
jgi:hypothetical protein